MPSPVPDSVLIELLNNAGGLSYKEGEARRRAIFRLQSIAKQKPNDIRVKLVLAVLHCRDGDSAHAEARMQSIALHKLAGDLPSLGLYTTASILLFKWDAARESLRRMAVLAANEKLPDAAYVTIAALLGDIDSIRKFSHEDDVGEVEEKVKLARRILDIVRKLDLESMLLKHAQVVADVLKGQVAIISNFHLLEDPDIGGQASLTFIHRLKLPFSERWSLQRQIREKLGDLYEAEGRPRYQWLNMISHVVAGADEVEERAA